MVRRPLPLKPATIAANFSNSNIFLKLENLQPSSSFKSRAVGNLMATVIAKHGPKKPIHFYCASGGNAGLACATAAISLQCPATIVVPRSTSALMIEKLKTLGADVKQVGEHWSEADAYLRTELLGKDKDGIYVPPFDHEDIWVGNATMIDEVEEQMCEYGGYDALVASVGGGGLFAGVMAGLEKHGRLEGGNSKEVKVLAVETKGADSLAHSLEKGELSRLNAITSIATSLGATQVANKAFEWAKRKEVTSCVFSDAEAAMGAVCFADDERIVVEAACGVSLAAVYNDALREILYPEVSDNEFQDLNIVIVVCGGSNVTLEMLQKYKETYSKDERVMMKFHSRRLASEGLKIERR